MESEIERMRAEIALLHAKVAAVVGCLDAQQAAKWKRSFEAVSYVAKIDPHTGESLKLANSVQTIPSSEGSE